MNENEPWTPSLPAEQKAITILSIRDTLRQRGPSVEDAASIIGMQADELRELVEARDLEAPPAPRLTRRLNRPPPPVFTSRSAVPRSA